MLHFITGRSGTGKSEYLKKYIASLAKAGEEKLLFIVPDQASFETESAFLKLLGPKLSQKISVLGFSRLCDYVFERTGHCFLNFADDGIRYVVMSLALEEVKDSLDLFSKRASSADLSYLMLSAVEEYKKCNITSDMLLDTAAACENETLKKKLCETAIVYDAYNALMEKSYMDPLDSLSKATGIITDERLFEEYTIAVDSFYGFTAQEYEAIRALMTQSREMYVSLCEDPAEENITDVFTVVRRTKSRLRRIAHENGVALASEVKLSENQRFEEEGLSYLEANLYRFNKIPYKKNTDFLTRYRAKDIYDECDFVGRNIRRLIEEGYRYRDIAVILRNKDDYAGILETALEKYDISYFSDKPYAIENFALVRLILSAFDITVKGFEREDVLALLKTGLTGYSELDIAEFENYLFIWDISKGRFFSPFTENPRGFSDRFSERERELLDRIEGMRADVISKLSRFSDEIKNTTGLQISTALMKLLSALKVRENISLLCDRFEEEQREDLSDEMIRLWNVMCEILDKMVAVIGDYRITPKKFSELLYIYFSNIEISSIPRGVDQVDVALADRALLSEKKTVFILSAVEGVFPHNPVEAGVFIDSERVALIDLKLPMSDPVTELYATEKYYVYRAMTAGSKKLFVSFPQYSSSGEKNNASSIITELCEIFPFIEESDTMALPVSEHCYSEKAAFEYLFDRYHSKSEDLQALRGYFEESETYAPILSAVESARNRQSRRIRDKSLSRALFSKNRFLSSSQVDKFYLCRFEYFCRYGLSVKERRRASIDALEYGTLMHYVMENFFRDHRDDDFSSITRETVEQEVSSLLDRYLQTHLGGQESRNKRFLYLYYRIRKTASDLVSRIVEELSQSEFRPSDFELSIGDEIPAYCLTLTDNTKVRIRGSVDRVDVYEKDGIEYIRIIDYKTGKKKFNLSDILYGLNLQMLIYLSAICANGGEKYGENITPAGVLYMPSVTPSARDSGKKSVEQLQKEMLKEYTMRGVVIEDKEILNAMDKTGEGTFIPVAVNADGWEESESLLSLQEMGAAFKKVDELVSEMASSLFEGEIDDQPAYGSGFDACAWCPYHAVCTHRDDDGIREIKKLSKQEICAELMGEEGEDETVDTASD